MLFVQPFFLLFFLPAAVALFYLARNVGGRLAGLGVIAGASLLFYLPYGALPIALLIGSLCINLLIGAALAAEGGTAKHRRLLLAGGLAADFGNLATFKYLDQIEAMFAPHATPILAIAIPAGISFYTFHQAVFLVHAFNREEAVVRFLHHPRRALDGARMAIRYAAFVAFFPQLIIGPITYLREFGPQIERLRFGRFSWLNVEVGVTLIVVGLFKKLVVADRLGAMVDPLYRDLSFAAISQQQAVFAVIGYFFQLYYDFSGYSDIALGIGRLFGLRLPINFDSPLRATGIVDFYRRWHMTLTRVIVLFVFTPLSLWGTRQAVEHNLKGWRARALGAWAPLLLNFQLIALWHAAKYTFVLFGLIHGVWYVLETELRRSKSYQSYRFGTSEPLRILAGILVTAAPLALTFALFRSTSVHDFWRLIQSLTGLRHPAGPGRGYVNSQVWLAVAGVAAIVYAFPNIYEILRRQRPGLPTFENDSITPPILRVAWRPNLVWGLFIAALLLMVLLNLNAPSPFLYGGF